MLANLGYDDGMMRSNRARVAGFVGFVFFGFLTVSAAAQINAAPPSVTSLGFGGRAVNGTPPSVTSLGPRGYTPGFNPAFPNSHPISGTKPFSNGNHPHHRNGYGAVYAVPYAYGYYDSGDDANAPPDDQYNGGPTIFDRRGSGNAVRPPETAYSANDPVPAAANVDALADPPAQDQPETVLVFKDGHQVEVANYAIVGNTLYDLSDGRRRRIAISDLDLDATTKQNDDRGIDFQVPSGS